MGRKNKLHEKHFKAGDFVFAKMRGYRSWPARILHVDGNIYNVFFYGTSNTAKLGAQQLAAYEPCRLRLGDPKKMRKGEFRRANQHAEFAVTHPTEDNGYFQTLAVLENSYVDASDLDLDLSSDECDVEQSPKQPNMDTDDDDAAALFPSVLKI